MIKLCFFSIGFFVHFIIFVNQNFYCFLRYFLARVLSFWFRFLLPLVSDLKAELKKRNLPVSGPKPQLIERLRSFAEHNSDMSNAVSSPSSQSNPNSPPRSSSTPPPPPPPPPPPLPQPSSGSQNTPEEDRIIREQQRRIEQLQKQLLNSQLQLQQQQQTRVQTFQVRCTVIPKNVRKKIKKTIVIIYHLSLVN